jgi:hypothetical protein
MARNENENLNGLSIPEEDLVEVAYIDKTGYVDDDENKAVAKTVTLHNKENEKFTHIYYVKHGRGELFDPYGMDMNKINAYNFQFKKVDKSIFENYIQYLRSRREIFLTQARRAFINKGF